jgi:hypothetical protein
MRRSTVSQMRQPSLNFKVDSNQRMRQSSIMQFTSRLPKKQAGLQKKNRLTRIEDNVLENEPQNDATFSQPRPSQRNQATDQSHVSEALQFDKES